MSRQLAFSIFVIFVLWLFIRDQKLRPMTSSALWIVLAWIVIIGSRAISSWFGGGVNIERPEDYLDGSPIDRTIFLIMIFTGLITLLRRKVNWHEFLTCNRWLFLLMLYWLISAVWSDYPYTSFKRWTKDIGNVIMVLVILTEKDHVQAFKAVFARFTYLIIPFSVCFIKYFPEYGRYYNRWTWLPAYCGVTTEKNMLGGVVFVCGMFLIWDFIEARKAVGLNKNRVDLMNRIILILMVAYLIVIANSATALVCLLLGAGILLLSQRPFFKTHVKYIGSYGLSIGLIVFLLYSIPNMRETLAEVLERDATFTGRTILWTELLSEPVNPLLGAGYQSFWLGQSAERFWEKYYYHPNQAHNGYIETYLNGGLLGLCLVIALIVSAGKNLKKTLYSDNSLGIIRFTFLIVVIMYNWTEAIFNKMSPIWIIMLIAVLVVPQLDTVANNRFKSIRKAAENTGLGTLRD